MAYDLSSSPPSLLRGSPSASARFSTISVVGGDIRVVGATRAPPGATVICRGGYESGECPFGRNIILNDDIGGARGGARNRAPPPLHERVCNARGNENRWNRVLCVGVENVWAAVRTFHAFCGIPSLRFFNLSMGE